MSGIFLRSSPLKPYKKATRLGEAGLLSVSSHTPSHPSVNSLRRLRSNSRFPAIAAAAATQVFSIHSCFGATLTVTRLGVIVSRDLVRGEHPMISRLRFTLPLGSRLPQGPAPPGRASWSRARRTPGSWPSGCTGPACRRPGCTLPRHKGTPQPAARRCPGPR